MQPILHLTPSRGWRGGKHMDEKPQLFQGCSNFTVHGLWKTKHEEQKNRIWTLSTWKNHYKYLLLCVRATLGSICLQGQERKHWTWTAARIHCLLSNSTGPCWDGEVSTCGSSSSANRGRCCLCSTTRAPARGTETHTAAPSRRTTLSPCIWSSTKPGREPQQQAPAILAEARAQEGPDSAGEDGTGTSQWGTLSCAGQPPGQLGLLGGTFAGASPPPRPGVTLQHSGQPSPGQRGRRSSSCCGRASPSPPFPLRSHPHPPGALSQIPRPRRLPADITV